jgi:ribosomal protein S18 acetylase RimI-like enzyme
LTRRTDVTVRDARPEDVPALARVHVESWRAAYRGLLPDAYLDGLQVRDHEELWWSRLRGEGFVVLADLGGVPVGYASGGPDRAQPDADLGEVYAIYVLDEFQGRGVGRALLAAAAERLQGEGFGRLRLWTLEGNRRARDFYRRLGGVQRGRQPLHLGGGSYTEVGYAWDDPNRLRE